MSEVILKIEIKKWTDGSVIFSHECDDNSIKRTLKIGVKLGISFKAKIISY